MAFSRINRSSGISSNVWDRWLNLVLVADGSFIRCRNYLLFWPVRGPGVFNPSKAIIWSELWSYKVEPHEQSWTFKILEPPVKPLYTQGKNVDGFISRRRDCAPIWTRNKV